MIGDLFINEKDAFEEWGLCMGKDFISNLMAPAPMKEYIENSSRYEHGKEVVARYPKVNSRNVTLTFYMHGADKDDYLQKYNSFVARLQDGTHLGIYVPALSNKMFYLLYKKSVSFDINFARTSSKISVSFEETNPSNRPTIQILP